MIECVIFDCDGTLIDSEYLCNLGLELKLKEYGVIAGANELMAEFGGRKLSNTVTQLQERHGVTFKDDFITSYRQLVDTLFSEQLQPCAGAESLLKRIALPMCVASNAPQQKMRKALSLTGLLPYFNNKLFSSYDVNAWKPDPSVFLHACQTMGFEPHQCLVVEDSPVGVQAALAAQMTVVQYDPHSTYAPIEHHHKVSHLSEIEPLINSLNAAQSSNL